MNPDDFQGLYKLLRGSRSAMTVLDAKTLFVEKRMERAFETLAAARSTYAESRNRLLRQEVDAQVDPKAKDADKQRKVVKRKQEKAIETLKAFDKLLPALERAAAREKAQRAADATRLSEPDVQPESEIESAGGRATDEDEHDGQEPVIVATSEDVSQRLAAEFVAADGEEWMDVIDRAFGFREVKTAEDIRAGALYLISDRDQRFLGCAPEQGPMDETVSLVSVVDDRPMPPLSRDEFVSLGRTRKLVMLTRRERAGEREESPQDAGSQDAGSLDTGDSNGEREAEGEPDDADEGMVPAGLDRGAFGQLLTSAQRCGLLPEADQIAYIRDGEFRKGNYDLAFQAIDAMFARFAASSNQRAQQLTREDAEIAAGRIKISPKDLLAKRSRDRMQTQEIERTRRRFQVVLEGLRRLINTG